MCKTFQQPPNFCMEKQALKIFVIFNTQLMEQSRIESIRFDLVNYSNHSR